MTLLKKKIGLGVMRCEENKKRSSKVLSDNQEKTEVT